MSSNKINNIANQASVITTGTIYSSPLSINSISSSRTGANLGDWLGLGDARINRDQLKDLIDLLKFIKSPAAGDLYHNFQLFQAEQKLKDE
jgi:hypothetical protein